MVANRLKTLKKVGKKSTARRGLSLAEVLAALIIGSMVLVAVLGIYSRAEKSAAAVTRKIEESCLPGEILQRIAEDLDRIIASDPSTKITIDSTRFDQGYQTAQLAIRKTFFDGKNQEQILEEIVWQAGYSSDANCLTLYRSHSGIALEDKLLEEKRESWEKAYPFIPICTGLTFFKVQVPRGQDFQDRWTSPALPPGITVTISFGEAAPTVRGTLDVPDEAKITRTIAIDRTRKIGFEIAPIGAVEKQGP